MKCPRCQAENPEAQKFCGECGTQLALSEVVTEPVTKTLWTPIERLATGSAFANRYQIIEELGEGGMGKVYKVLDREIDTRIALKLIKPEVAIDQKTIERFRNELKTAREISHKNVCRMYHLGRYEGSYYITMEFVDGEDLKSTIRRVGPLGAGKAVAIAKQVCEGLVEAHRAGVVHRDLKPNNIMIDKEGNAKIMDFGIARSIKAEGVTGPGVMIGTPEYMSPEQAEAKEVDHRSDIYSLGVILFEMLTGRLPFEGETPLSIALKHKSEDPVDPRELNPQIPEDLSMLILKCLEKDKQARNQSAEEVRVELIKIEKGIPTTTRESKKERKITSKEITVSFRLRKLLVPALVVVALLIVGLFLWQPWSQKDTLQSVSTPPSIAVLPFEDISPQKDQEYLCDGMTDQIITNLTRIPELKVIARASVMQFKGSQKNIRQISEELGVKYILDGTIRKSGNQLRVSASLIDADEGVNVWANDYNRDWKDIIEIQDDVSKSIANTLEIALSDQTRSALEGSYARNAEAYDYYLRAKHFVENTYMNTKEEKDFQYALELAKRAVELDPEFAMGYIGLGYLYENRWLTTLDNQDLAEEKKYIKKAYELNSNIAEVNAALSLVLLREGDYDGSFSRLNSALELNPNSHLPLHMAGVFCVFTGLYHQGSEFYLRAIEYDPLSFHSLGGLGFAFTILGEPDHALQYIEKSYRIQPKFAWGLSVYAFALVTKRDFEKAEEIMKQVEFLPLGYGARLFSTTKALFHASLGEREKALAIRKTGVVLAVLGMKDEALDLIDKASQTETDFYEGFYTYLSLVNLPFYDSLRDDPRFEEIVKREKEKYEQRLKKYNFLL